MRFPLLPLLTLALGALPACTVNYYVADNGRGSAPVAQSGPVRPPRPQPAGPGYGQPYPGQYPPQGSGTYSGQHGQNQGPSGSSGSYPGTVTTTTPGSSGTQPNSSPQPPVRNPRTGSAPGSPNTSGSPSTGSTGSPSTPSPGSHPPTTTPQPGTPQPGPSGPTAQSQPTKPETGASGPGRTTKTVKPGGNTTGMPGDVPFPTGGVKDPHPEPGPGRIPGPGPGSAPASNETTQSGSPASAPSTAAEPGSTSPEVPLVTGGIKAPVPTRGGRIRQVPGASTPGDAPVSPGGEAPQSENPVVVFRKTPCLGPCPYFEASMWADGRVRYTGYKNVPKIGTFELRLPAATVQDFLQQAAAIGFADMQAQYLSGATDMPSTFLTINRPGGASKTVQSEEGAPADLMSLLGYINNEIERIANSGAQLQSEKVR